MGQDWKAYLIWCKVNFKKPSHYASLKEYIRGIQDATIRT